MTISASKVANIVAPVLLLFALFVVPALAGWKVNERGQVVNQGSVLGKKDSNPGQGKKTEKTSQEHGKPEGIGQEASDEDKSDHGKPEDKDPQNRPSQTDSFATDDEDEATESGTKKAPSGKTKKQSDSDATNSARIKHIKLLPNKDQVRVKFEDQNGVEFLPMDATESGSFDIDESLDKRTVKVRAKDNAAYVIRNKIAAQTHFPLMVNPETNELIVTTPHGEKTVTILPDQAVQNMLAANVLDVLGGKGGILWEERRATPSATPDLEATGSATPEPEATESGDLETPEPEPEDEPDGEEVEGSINLVETDEGGLAYEIEGIKKAKAVGFLPVELRRTIHVSAETGELLNVDQDFWTNLLDLISF